MRRTPSSSLNEFIYFCPQGLPFCLGEGQQGYFVVVFSAKQNVCLKKPSFSWQGTFHLQNIVHVGNIIKALLSLQMETFVIKTSVSYLLCVRGHGG